MTGRASKAPKSMTEGRRVIEELFLDSVVIEQYDIFGEGKTVIQITNSTNFGVAYRNDILLTNNLCNGKRQMSNFTALNIAIHSRLVFNCEASV